MIGAVIVVFVLFGMVLTGIRVRAILMTLRSIEKMMKRWETEGRP
jgi:hypothetical protein